MTTENQGQVGAYPQYWDLRQTVDIFLPQSRLKLGEWPSALQPQSLEHSPNFFIL